LESVLLEASSIEMTSQSRDRSVRTTKRPKLDLSRGTFID